MPNVLENLALAIALRSMHGKTTFYEHNARKGHQKEHHGQYGGNSGKYPHDAISKKPSKIAQKNEWVHPLRSEEREGPPPQNEHYRIRAAEARPAQSEPRSDFRRRNHGIKPQRHGHDRKPEQKGRQCKHARPSDRYKGSTHAKQQQSRQNGSLCGKRGNVESIGIPTCDFRRPKRHEPVKQSELNGYHRCVSSDKADTIPYSNRTFYFHRHGRASLTPCKILQRKPMNRLFPLTLFRSTHFRGIEVGNRCAFHPNTDDAMRLRSIHSRIRIAQWRTNTEG